MVKNIFRVLICTAIIAGGSHYLTAQDTLRVADAIRQGLERNYLLEIAENNARIAANNNSLGNAGMLPVLTGDAALNKRVEDNVTTYPSPTLPDRNVKNAETKSYSYGLNASWTVFDGLTMFAVSDRLAAGEKIGSIESQLQIEDFLAEIISLYYTVVGRQKAFHVLENTVEVSEERIRIAETQRDLGSGSEYNLLLAKADYNEDKAALIRARNALNQAKIGVNRIISDTGFAEFDVQSSIELGKVLQLDSLRSSALSQNTELQLARLEEKQAKTAIREINGEWMPQIALNGGYGYTKSESSTGFSNFSETKGFNYGITARINLFDGFNKSRRRQNAQLTLKNEQLRYQDLELETTARLLQIYLLYRDALDLIELEQENLAYNRQSQDIALERFRLGTISSIELRETQQSLLNAENRLIAAQIEAKNAETELLRLSGLLLHRDNL